MNGEEKGLTTVTGEVGQVEKDDDTTEPVAIQVRDPEEAELASLVYEMAKQLEAAVKYIRNQSGMEPAEADARVRDLLALGGEGVEGGNDGNNVIDGNGNPDNIVLSLPQKATWAELERLAARDPRRMLARWHELYQAALDELSSGHRAAAAVEAPSEKTPWDRARFTALRASYIEEWQPRGGIEQSLIDMMAQAYTLYSHWLSVLTQETGTSTERRTSIYSPRGILEPPRVSEVEAMKHAAEMVDRFHKLYMRTLRQLRDLRRYSPPVLIQNAQQVNIGNQQLNLAEAAQEGTEEKAQGEDR